MHNTTINYILCKMLQAVIVEKCDNMLYIVENSVQCMWYVSHKVCCTVYLGHSAPPLASLPSHRGLHDPHSNGAPCISTYRVAIQMQTTYSDCRLFLHVKCFIHWNEGNLSRIHLIKRPKPKTETKYWQTSQWVFGYKCRPTYKIYRNFICRPKLNIQEFSLSVFAVPKF